MLGEIAVTVLREEGPGTWVSGRYVRGPCSIFSVMGSVQPLVPQQVEALPEGARTTARYGLWCDEQMEALRSVDLATQAGGDRVIFEGRQYAVFSVGDWTQHGAPTAHRAYVLLQVGEDEDVLT